MHKLAVSELNLPIINNVNIWYDYYNVYRTMHTQFKAALIELFGHSMGEGTSCSTTLSVGGDGLQPCECRE